MEMIVDEDQLLANSVNNLHIKESIDTQWLKGTSAEVEIQKQKENKKSADFSDPIFKTISKLNGKINNMTFQELVTCLKDLKLDTRGKKEILKKRLKTYQKKVHLERQSMVIAERRANNEQKSFDYICVIDFEATCTETSTTNYPHEIIEFPIVLVNMRTKEIEDTFQSYVKPIINPILTKFCVHLTGITQDKVDNAQTFSEVLCQVETWLKTKELGTKYKFTVATDGPWDMQNFMNLQCYHSQIEFPNWARNWIDIRKTFSNWFGLRRCGIEKMLKYFGLEFEGKQHCGLDDATNIARIMLKLVEDGCPLKKNDYLRHCKTDKGIGNEIIDEENNSMELSEQNDNYDE